MKKYLLPFLPLFLAAWYPANAQTFAEDSMYVTGATTDTVSNNEVDAFIYFHNNGSKAVKIKWELIYDTVPTAWQFGICDNVNCYYNNPIPLLDATHFSDTISVGDSMTFEARYNPYCDSGLGTLKVSANIFGVLPLTYDTLTFVAKINTDCSAAAVVDLNSGIKPLQLFPNPTPDNITIQGLAANNHTLVINILDIQGQSLQSVSRLNNGQLSVDCKNLPVGIYLMRVTDLQDGSMNMGKFSKL